MSASTHTNTHTSKFRLSRPSEPKQLEATQGGGIESDQTHYGTKPGVRVWVHFPVLPLRNRFVYAGLRGWFRPGLNVLGIALRALGLKASFGLGASLLGTPNPYAFHILRR